MTILDNMSLVGPDNYHRKKILFVFREKEDVGLEFISADDEAEAWQRLSVHLNNRIPKESVTSWEIQGGIE